MKKEGNFSKALDELFAGKFKSSKDASSALDMSLGSLVAHPETEDGVEAPPDGPGPAAARQLPLREALITPDMVIKGSLTSSSNILLEGTVLGDIICEGDLAVKGRVEGNVRVRSLSVQGGSISGDIDSVGTVYVGEDSTIDGNIKGGHIDINGTVTGNISSNDRLTLNPKASIEGDIAAFGISVFDGAQIKGNVNVRKPA
ncbi:MAG TPA: polymer-forming cytoskeletal protein [Rectinemataceae bacterium]